MRATVNRKRRRAGIPDTNDLEELWQHFKHDLDFFQNIKIDRQAGFDEIKGLFARSRYFGATIAATFFFLNSYSLLNVNINLLNKTKEQEIFTCSEFFARQYLGVTNLDSARVLAIMELTLLGGLWVWFLYNLGVLYRASTPCRRWMGVAQFWYDTVPQASTLSLVKLLNYVTPAVLVPELTSVITATMASGCGRRGLDMLWFIVSRVACLLAGLDAFLYKFQILSVQFKTLANSNHVGEGFLLMNTVIFLNQILGVVQVGWFVKSRIFLFIFAGEDGQMSEKEKAVKLLFEAMVARKLWEELRPIQAIAVYLTFSDYDFQKMVLDTTSQASVRSLS